MTQQILKLMQKIIILSGPTASGKSELALKIAKAVGGEIINADIGSMYQSLTIGTAKPEWQNFTVQHHLFDIYSQPENCSIAEYRIIARKTVHEIFARGKLPIIVGGSTMYIKALFFSTHTMPDTKPVSEQLYEQLQSGQIKSEQLWQKLYEQDPKRALKIHKNDAYRIVQALAIVQITKQKASNFEQYFDPIASFYWITCTRDRAQLYDLINQRVIAMMQQGWIAEVEKLQNTKWADFLMKKKIIGYDDILYALQKNQSINDAQSKIQQKTRHYAKRQMLFFKKLQNNVNQELLNQPHIGFVHDLNLTLCDVGLYIKGLSNQISTKI